VIFSRETINKFQNSNYSNEILMSKSKYQKIAIIKIFSHF